MYSETYLLAQRAVADLKGAVVALLAAAPASELSNAQIGRALGIYGGHIGHEGHIPRTLLEVLKSEGVVIQNAGSKRWRLVRLDEPEG
jgi:hypothetical protein